MLPADKKLQTQESEGLDLDAVELDKSPKRVLRSGKNSPGRTKKRNADASVKTKPPSSPSKGTRKPPPPTTQATQGPFSNYSVPNATPENPENTPKQPLQKEG